MFVPKEQDDEHNDDVGSNAKIVAGVHHLSLHHPAVEGNVRMVPNNVPIIPREDPNVQRPPPRYRVADA